MPGKTIDVDEKATKIHISTYAPAAYVAKEWAAATGTEMQDVRACLSGRLDMSGLRGDVIFVDRVGAPEGHGVWFLSDDAGQQPRSCSAEEARGVEWNRRLFVERYTSEAQDPCMPLMLRVVRDRATGKPDHFLLAEVADRNMSAQVAVTSAGRG